MLDKINLRRKIAKAEYKKVKDDLDLRLGALQREARDLGIPLMVVFEGWEAAGKGTLINKLILPLDPRGFTVHNILPPTEDERLRPFLWRFWRLIPAKGRMAIFDRSWYRSVIEKRAKRKMSVEASRQAYQDIGSFEEQLADDGYAIVKFFLHISKKEQKKRFEKLRANPATAWRVTKADLKTLDKYDRYRKATDEMLLATDGDFAPWTVVEAHDERFATLKIFNVVINALESAIAAKKRLAKSASAKVKATDVLPSELATSILDDVDLSKSMEKEDYKRELKELQKTARDLEYQMYQKRLPVLILYEGWDAAGKGGNIRRLTQNLDPRGYEVVPIAAPNDVEKARHYLWRFWTQIPKAGHMTIFDRTWYGRVLVERVEGFCSEAEWKRAYREINDMELHLANFGAVILKFWIQIDKEEQLRRFEERKKVAHKQWKITDEDWRNREKWDQYKSAVEEMLFRTSTPHAPWTIVESNCKYYARVKVLKTVIDAIAKRV